MPRRARPVRLSVEYGDAGMLAVDVAGVITPVRERAPDFLFTAFPLGVDEPAVLAFRLQADLITNAHPERPLLCVTECNRANRGMKVNVYDDQSPSCHGADADCALFL